MRNPAAVQSWITDEPKQNMSTEQVNDDSEVATAA